MIASQLVGDCQAEPLPLVGAVSDTTLAFDRDRKLPLYARAGVAEFWLVDIASVAIERYTDPVNGRYRQRLLAGRGEELWSLRLPEITITIDTLFQGL